MDHGQLSMAADTFPWVFSASVLNACGKEVQFCRRQRVSTPLRLGVALTATCASQPVETIADFHGGVHALFGTTITSKAFSNPVAKPHCADVARTMTERLIGEMTLQVLGCAQGHPCGELRRLILQDGSSFAIHDGLREVLPGRCTTVKPAAVALHTTMDLLCDAPTTVLLTPDTTNAPAFWPEPATLTGALLLADRGSIDVHSRRRVQDAGGGCLIRANAGMNPQILEALREDGQRLRSLRQKSLQTIHATRPTRQRVARVVQGHVDGRPLRLRLLVSGHRRQQALCSLLTHLPAPRDTLEMICRASTWRWHGAWLFQAWKSYANLQAFDTANPAIVAGVMWTAIAAAALTRFLAHMTPLLVEGPLSTRKVAMGALHVWGDLVRALPHGDVTARYAALEAAITSLSCHAQRAHPKRDRQTGRAQLGLAFCFEHDDMIECAEAA